MHFSKNFIFYVFSLAKFLYRRIFKISDFFSFRNLLNLPRVFCTKNPKVKICKKRPNSKFRANSELFLEQCMHKFTYRKIAVQPISRGKLKFLFVGYMSISIKKNYLRCSQRLKNLFWRNVCKSRPINSLKCQEW